VEIVKYKHVSNGFYGLGFIGALIFYLQQAASFWTVMIGIFKALFWPAFLVYQLMVFLKM
jgi:hypothetical protein